MGNKQGKMEDRIKKMISILTTNGKMDENQHEEVEKSLKGFYSSVKKISYMNVGERYLDMTVHTAIGSGSDRVYMVKKDNEDKWYVLDAKKNIIN